MTKIDENSSKDDIKKLQKALKDNGFSPGKVDGDFGPATEAALIAFQKSENLLADGVAGQKTLGALGLLPENAEPIPSAAAQFTVKIVSKMFPFTPIDHIKEHLPFVLKALTDAGLDDTQMILMALASIRAETESFEPISEYKSKYNTSPGGHAFDLYDKRADLGNKGKPDGEQFRGRGFVQLTGRANYKEHGAAIGLGDQLVKNPKIANDPKIAAELLASFLKSKERKIKEALLENDLKQARKFVNGGSHGLDRFVDAYNRGRVLVV